MLSLNQFIVVVPSIGAMLCRFRADLYATCIRTLVNMLPQLLHYLIDRRHTLLVVFDHGGIQYFVVSFQIGYSIFLNLVKKLRKSDSMLKTKLRLAVRSIKDCHEIIIRYGTSLLIQCTY